MTFTTPLVLSGPLRAPKQMLHAQTYDGHASIHDDAMAGTLGFRAGPIEGPTHFSLYPPLLYAVFGRAWFEQGCISAHYQNMVVEGEETRAFVEVPPKGASTTNCRVEKADGTPVQEASVTLGEQETLLDRRIRALRPPERLVILSDLRVGMLSKADERVRMDPDQNMGDLYPFTLNQKLANITETTPWYSDPRSSPWGRSIIPLEMVSVLAEYTSRDAGFPLKGPAVGLFADQQIRMVDGPLFVGVDYVLRREIIALSESKRTESYWVKTRIYDADRTTLKAEMILNHAMLKQSYANYEAERNA